MYTVCFKALHLPSTVFSTNLYSKNIVKKTKEIKFLSSLMVFHELFQREDWTLGIPELWSLVYPVKYLGFFLESAQCWQPQKNSFRIITDNNAEAFFSKEQPIPLSFQHIILPLWNPCMRAALLKGPTPWLMGLGHARAVRGMWGANLP